MYPSDPTSIPVMVPAYTPQSMRAAVRPPSVINGYSTVRADSSQHVYTQRPVFNAQESGTREIGSAPRKAVLGPSFLSPLYGRDWTQ